MDTKQSTCMACACPCDKHKEHTHGEEHGKEKCAACGREHAQGEKCGCEC